MRKKVYAILEALDNGYWVSVKICKLDGTSSRVRNEISELRRKYGVRIITVENFLGRCAAYFLVYSGDNFERVKMLLKTYKNDKILSNLK